MNILINIDIENAIRLALKDYFTIYCLPLPEKFKTPSLLVQRVGGTEDNKIDTFSVTLDARAKTEKAADELLRMAIGTLKEIAKMQTTEIRAVTVNASGSWGKDPVRPDLTMCTARLEVVAHQTKTII